MYVPDLANLIPGPIDGWSPDLRGMCNLIMASPHPSAMYWGPEHVAIYNEAYIALAGKKHPELMGKRYSDVWAEIWPAVANVFANALSSAQATMKDDDCKFLITNSRITRMRLLAIFGSDPDCLRILNRPFHAEKRIH
jgi:hypothetical protein